MNREEDDDGGLLALLTQRAVQTVCYTYRQCRDGPTASFLARFNGDGAAGFERFHGIDALRGSWREYLSALLKAPTEKVEVESTVVKNRGVSPNNPYVQPQRMTYSHEIRPSELGERVMVTARLIAVEWVEDLALMSAENAEVIRRRRAVVASGNSTDAERNNQLPIFSVDQDNNCDSPYRGGNYDLLLTLATRHAAVKALRDLGSTPSRAAEAACLRRHCEEVPLLGELPLHAADVWVEALMERPIIMSTSGGVAGFVDPLRIAETVLEHRATVAEGWSEMLADVPEIHTDIKRELLEERTTFLRDDAPDIRDDAD